MCPKYYNLRLVKKFERENLLLKEHLNCLNNNRKKSENCKNGFLHITKSKILLSGSHSVTATTTKYPPHHTVASKTSKLIHLVTDRITVTGSKCTVK